MKTFDLSQPGMIDDVAALAGKDYENVATRIRVYIYRKWPIIELIEKRSDRLQVLRDHFVTAEVDCHSITILADCGQLVHIELAQHIVIPDEPEQEHP